MFPSLVSLQKYIEAPLFQIDLIPAQTSWATMRISGMTELYIAIGYRFLQSVFRSQVIFAIRQFRLPWIASSTVREEMRANRNECWQ